MKVLHVLSSNKFSGAENVACQIISMMKDVSDIEMAYCSPDGEIRKALSDRGITFVPVQEMNTLELKKAIQDYQPDLIHAHDMRASFLSARVCEKRPLISHIHNNAFDSQKLSIKSVAYLYAAYKAKHIFWVSQSAQNGYHFRNLVASKSSVLQNIIDVEALYKKASQDPEQYSYDIVYLGRLSYEKNPLRLLDIISKVVTSVPTAKLAIIGSGDLEDELLSKRSELKLEQNVFLLGFRDNPYKILRDSKVMLMTSRWEGLPMCALESLALGVPIVSTPTDGLTELIQPGITGYLGDDDTFLAEKIVQIISDDSLRIQFSKNARAEALRSNDMKTYYKKILNVYKCKHTFNKQHT